MNDATTTKTLEERLEMLEARIARLEHREGQMLSWAQELAATNETSSNEKAGDVTMPDDQLQHIQRILGGPTDAFDEDRPRPVQYALAFYEGSFENDGCAIFCSNTPFLPISVGDFISRSTLPAVEGKEFKATAVRHRIKKCDSDIFHHVEVCIEATT